jgi:hypothetical protein
MEYSNGIMGAKIIPMEYSNGIIWAKNIPMEYSGTAKYSNGIFLKRVAFPCRRRYLGYAVPFGAKFAARVYRYIN